jgi:Fe-S-cluster containining protein
MTPWTQAEIRDLGPDQMPAENKRWALEDLTPINRREGLRRSPYLTDGGVTILGDERTGEAVMVWSRFYECRHYDRENKRCMDYENRPPVCRDYPWYGQAPDPLKSLPLECSYREDVTTVGVTIADKLNARFTRG